MSIPAEDLQCLLDDISVCFIINDFGLWQSRTTLPFVLITRDGPVILRTEAELRDNFSRYLVARDMMNLDQVFRELLSCEDCEDGTWIATYRTHLISNGQRMADPYVSSALIFCENNTYRIKSIMNARGHLDWTGDRGFMLD